MKKAQRPKPVGKTLLLTVVMVLQAACAGFFVFDSAADFLGILSSNESLHNAIELVAVIVLVVGTGITAVQIRRIRAQNRRIEAQLRVASGAFQELLEENFAAWGLTPSERDVALLSIKGLSTAEIASIRATKEGTIKAQSNAIYQKAGVSGRQQLLSLFIEDLMTDELVPPSPQT
jgi:DNA-binding CsgD family transcriptional regulator